MQNDTYYTVRIGEWITENGISDLTKDYYSWHDLPYTYPHWLYDFIMYQIYNLGGWDAIYISTIVFTMIMGLSLYYISTKLSKNSFVSFIVTMGAMYVLKPFVTARAQLVTFILFAWALYFIEQFLDPKQTSIRRVLYGLLLVVIPIAITNLHCAVFPFYFVLFLPYIGEYIIACVVDWDLDKRFMLLCIKFAKLFIKKENKVERNLKLQQVLKNQIEERKQKRIKLRKNPYKIKIAKNHLVLLLIAVMIIAGFTGFLNPAGNGAYTYVIRTMKGNTTNLINEHLPLQLLENKEFSVTMIVFLAVLIFTDTKIKLSDLFMLAGLTYLSFKMRRQVSMFAIFCGFILAKMIASFIVKYAKDTDAKLYKFFTKPLGILLIIAIVFSIGYDIYRPNRTQEYVNESSYPVGACKWIKENLDLSYIKLYNEYNFGSYVLFEGIQVFVDSRCDLYTPQFNGDDFEGTNGKDIFSDSLNIAGYGTDYNAQFDNYGVTHILSFANSKLCLALSSDSRYRKLYDDGIFRVYAKIDKEREIDKLVPSLGKNERTFTETVLLSGEISGGEVNYEENNLD